MAMMIKHIHYLHSTHWQVAFPQKWQPDIWLHYFHNWWARRILQSIFQIHHRKGLHRILLPVVVPPITACVVVLRNGDDMIWCDDNHDNNKDGDSTHLLRDWGYWELYIMCVGSRQVLKSLLSTMHKISTSSIAVEIITTITTIMDIQESMQYVITGSLFMMIIAEAFVLCAMVAFVPNVQLPLGTKKTISWTMAYAYE